MKYATELKHVMYLFMTIQSCFAMEKIEKEEEITPFIKDEYILPFGSTYFSKKCIYSNSGTPCITNRVTGHTTKISGLVCNSAPLMYANNTKMIFNCTNTAKIYDLKENKIEKSLEFRGGQLLSIQASSFDNTILLVSENDQKENTVIIYRFLDTSQCYVLPESTKKNTIFIFHPQKQSLFEIRTAYINKYNYGHPNNSIEFPRLPDLGYDPTMYRVSPEGFIAVIDNARTTISIMHLDNINQRFSKIKNKPFERCLNMIFYSKGSVLAIMFFNIENSKVLMRYWDVMKKQYIATTELSDGYLSGFFYFSCSGKKIILPYWEKTRPLTIESAGSYISTVPFNVRYKDGTREKFPLLLFLLNNHITNCQRLNNQVIPLQVIPLEVINYLKHIYLKSFKR